MNPTAIVDSTVNDFLDNYLSSGFMAVTKHSFHSPKHRKLNCQNFSEGCLFKYIAISLEYDCLTCTDVANIDITTKMTAILLLLEGF